jgi:hypothetical protein
MMTDDLISSSGESQTQETPSYIDELVGEGKKYANIEELAKGAIHAQNHIQNLENENKAIRFEKSELEKRTEESTTLDDIMQRLSQTQTDSAPVNQTVPQTPDVEQVIKSELEKRDQQARAQQNRLQVSKALLDSFEGDTEQAKAHRDVRLSQLGMDDVSFQAFAERSPNAAIALLTNNQPQQPSISVSDRNLGGTPPQPTVKNKAYYDNLRKEMGTRKFHDDLGLQLEMQANAEVLIPQGKWK